MFKTGMIVIYKDDIGSLLSSLYPEFFSHTKQKKTTKNSMSEKKITTGTGGAHFPFCYFYWPIEAVQLVFATIKVYNPQNKDMFSEVWFKMRFNRITMKSSNFMVGWQHTTTNFLLHYCLIYCFRLNIYV